MRVLVSQKIGWVEVATLSEASQAWPGGALPVVRSSFATTDPDEVSTMVSSAYGVRSLRLSGDRKQFAFRHDRTDLGEVRLDTVSNTQTIDVELDASPAILVSRVIEQELVVDGGAGPRRFGPGDIMVASHCEHGYRLITRDLHVQVTSIDLSWVRYVAGDDIGPGWLPPSEACGRLFAADTGRSWQHTVDYIRSVVDEQSLSSTLVLSNACRLLAATLLAAVNPPAAPSRLESHDATSRSMQRAIAFIETSPDLDIGVADIARAAHVSPRAIQLAFRRHLDTTPMAYLRRVRLDRAHADLRAAGVGEGATVTAIAARWGFSRTSRFAQQYRAAYGEPPSATLRR